ncbi:UNVERIFIED_CONTAM: putative late blight resistance proteinR1A-10 [Sesamum radiatum]|uniref:Late blight resistance proteinR1A-10 n=1 Tax=Sesamum radiatum TaxID=300843 RepID=A0AAW2JW93_SESRA
MIATSCKGLPLAIVVIAGVLSTVSRTQASWEDIAEEVKLAITANDEQFAKILSLSYTYLPHHLRPCFLYMGAFPEDYEIHVSRLVKLWIGEGFMKPSVSKSFEELAEEYLEDLVKKSLVLVTRRKPNGKIKSCSVHDLVRDLCKRKAGEEKFLLHATDRLLRVLDALRVTVTNFPADVLELFHLRHTERLESLSFVGETCFSYNAEEVNLEWLFALPPRYGDYRFIAKSSCAETEKFHFRGWKWEITEGEFRQLKFLEIGSSYIKHWITESSHFPSLETLLLYWVDLDEIPNDIGDIPTLQLIEVKTRKVSLVNSAKRIKKRTTRLWE